MTDAEQRLARWLQTATPEPPHQITAEMVLSAAPGAHRRVARRRWVQIIAAAAAVIAMIATIVSVSHGKHSLPAVPVTSTGTTSRPPPPTSRTLGAAPPSDFSALRIIGSRGATAWKLTDALSVTTDTGDHWSTVSLPHAVAAASIGTIEIAPDSTIWMTAVTNETIQLYRRDPGAAGWNHSVLVPERPPGSSTGLQPVAVSATHDHGGVFALVAGWGLKPASGYYDVFVSTDHGATFAQHPTGSDQGISSVTFLNSQVGLAVAGPTDNLVYRTHNGGRTWNRLLGGDPNTDVYFGAPVTTGRGVELPRAAGHNDGSQDISIWVSTDLGAHFTPTPQKSLHVPPAASSGNLRIAINASDVWVPAYGRIYESTDNGQTWVEIPMTTSVDHVSLAGAGRATGQASADCSSNASTAQCFSTSYLIATDDGGRHWHTL